MPALCWHTKEGVDNVCHGCALVLDMEKGQLINQIFHVDFRILGAKMTESVIGTVSTLECNSL